MNIKPQELFVGLVEALAEPIRLRLLRLLERQELGVTEICEVVQLPQSTVSRHLKVLVENGWLRIRHQGTSNRYRMERHLSKGARQLWEVAREETRGWVSIEQDEWRLARHLESKRSNPRGFFNQSATAWDALRRQLYGESYFSAAALALLPPEWCVADLGCGTGHLTAQLAPRVRRVVGIDESGAMLAEARNRTALFPNVELVEGSLEELPLDKDTFHGALLLLALSYASDPQAVVQEMCRILRPGGRGVIVDILAHGDEQLQREMGHLSLGFGPAELGTLLAEAGFEEIRLDCLPPEPHSKGLPLFLAAVRRPQSILP